MTGNHVKPARVAIIHPWLPQYRVSFFELLVERARAQGLTVDVFYGDTPPEWRARGDGGSSGDFQKLRTRFIRVGSRYLIWKSIRPLFNGEPYDLVIVEHAVRNLETYRLLLSPTYCRRVAFWGHGKNYTVSRSRVERTVKSVLTRFGCWFFSYTDGGVEAVVSAGYSAERCTVVHNSVDTSELRGEYVSITDEDISRLSEEIAPGKCRGLYIGGLDASKRVDFLLESCALVARRVPDFVLLIVGDGDMRPLVESVADSSSWLVYLGPRFGREKATALRVSRCLLVPGRVGLIAVDSAAVGVPIVTTNWPYHAPEFEYLTPDVNCVVSADSVTEFADEVAELIEDSRRLEELAVHLRSLGDELSIERMTGCFLDGLVGAVRRVGSR